MPAVSEKQRRAMWAAAEGHSKLGIPQSVGEEFVKNDSNQTRPEFGDLSDFEAAEAIRDGDLPSPTEYKDEQGNTRFWLFDLRITGTGMAWRDSIAEWAFRDPSIWLTDEFVQRCNGLMVIQDHPEQSGLNHEEFQQRAIGSIILPYIKGEEVWGVAKIFDADAALMMQQTHRSTSPGVTPPAGARAISLESGAQVLDEGLPLVLDHLAVCAAGVWDKDGPPEGVRLDSLIGKGEVVADKSVEELERELQDAKARADKLEQERADEKHRADSAEMERDSHKKRADEAEEREEERKREDAKRMDARKKRHDEEAHEGDLKDCSRCDSEESGEKPEATNDAAKVAEPDAARGTDDIKDSKIAEMQRQIDALTAANKPLSIEERDELSRSFHRYSGLFAMLMDSTPQPLPGEKPIAYRKRCANALRKYTQGFQNYVFHDSQQAKDFELVENAIYDEALAYAKNPPADKMAGQLREIKDSTTLPGKVITRFVGDANAAWEPFKAPVQRFLKRVNKSQPMGAAH